MQLSAGFALLCAIGGIFGAITTLVARRFGRNKVLLCWLAGAASRAVALCLLVAISVAPRRLTAQDSSRAD